MPKRIGRPRVDPDDESIEVSFTLPARQFDRVASDARREQVSIGTILRRAVANRRGDDDDGDD
jgi:hypothetical protein